MLSINRQFECSFDRAQLSEGKREEEEGRGDGRCERSWRANERVEISNDLRTEGVRAYVS